MKHLRNSSESSLAVILNSLDAVVYVSDIESYELLFINNYGMKKISGAKSLEDIREKRCWEVLQKNQTGPCDFCTNGKLPKNGEVYVWEFKNTLNDRWYQCRDRLIDWHDGRRVRLEVAVDISERKSIELKLNHAQAELKKLAETDELTGIFNRRAFFKYAQSLRDSLSDYDDMALAILDLDHFKRINDEHGHEAGDELLKYVGRMLFDFYGDSAVVGRMGGEEFAVAFSAEVIDIEVFSKDLLQLINSTKTCYFGTVLHCTASIGVAQSENQLSIKELLRKADTALYEAKNAGRSQVKVA